MVRAREWRSRGPRGPGGEARALEATSAELDGGARQDDAAFPALEARGLGDGEVRYAGERIDAKHWQSPKSKELFFYLLCHPGWQRRERIEADVWGDAAPAQARSGFHTNAHRLRRALYQGLLQAQGQRYRLHPDANCWFDAEEFGRRCAALFGPEEAPDFAEQAAAALALYRGPFLADVSSEWTEPFRAQLEILHRELLTRLARAHATPSEDGAAVRLALRGPASVYTVLGDST